MKIQSLVGGDDIVEDLSKKKASGKTGPLSCQSCSLNGKTKVVEPDNPDAEVLIIGEAPGKTDEATGHLFAGASGTLFKDCLVKAGWLAKDFQLSTVCRCRLSDELGNSRSPSKREVNICFELYLKRMLSRFNKILVVGKIPVIAVLGKAYNKLRGNVAFEKGKLIAATYSPTYVLRNRNKLSACIDDLRFFKQVFFEDYRPKFQIVTTEADRSTCLKDLQATETVIFDIETTGLKIDSQLLVVGVHGATKAWPIPIVGKYQGNVDFVKHLLSLGKLYVGYNSTFEYKMLRASNLCPRGLTMADVKVQDHALDPGKARKGEAFGLKALGVRNGLHWSRLELNPAEAADMDRLCWYNAEDLINTHALYYKLHLQVEENKLLPVVTKVINPAINVIGEMEGEGIELDTDEIGRVRKKLVAQKDIVATELSKRFGEINWGSTTQLGKKLEELKVPAIKTTAAGRYGTDAESIDLLMEAHPEREDVQFLCGHISILRKASKLLSTYVDGLEEKLSADGRLRGSFNLTGTGTGRLSSNGPNLQNIPRGNLIKSMFVAKQGYTLLEADASQVELRIAASIAPEPVMIEAYVKEADLHKLTASFVLNKAIEKVTVSERQLAKAVNFGLLYGQSWQGFRMYAKAKFAIILSDEEARSFRTAFFTKYQGLNAWHNSVTHYIRQGFDHVRTPFGRIRYLMVNDTEGHKIRQALNTPVQSSASDCTLLFMRYLWDRIDPAKCTFLLTVHDQVLLEIAKGYVSETRQLISDGAEYVTKTVKWLKCPFVMDTKVGDTWGSLK